MARDSVTEVATHTPLPWSTAGVSNPNTNPRMSLWGPRSLHAQSGEWIAKDITPANVALILRAVNCHADLLAACHAAHAWFASHGDSLPSSAVRVVTILDAAIAQAEQR